MGLREPTESPKLVGSPEALGVAGAHGVAEAHWNRCSQWGSLRLMDLSQPMESLARDVQGYSQ